MTSSLLENLEPVALENNSQANHPVAYRTPKSTQNPLLTEMQTSFARNEHRPPQGHRFDAQSKSYWTYQRILSGKAAYETTSRNASGAVPSEPTVARYITRNTPKIIEGILRVDEYFQFCMDNNLKLFANLSEDATRIVGGMTYDFPANQIKGPPLPLDNNGMPIPNAFPARSAHHIEQYSELPQAKFALVVMAQPL